MPDPYPNKRWDERVELIARRLFAEDGAKYREYLEKQFIQLKWAIGVVAVVAGGLLTYLFGSTRAELDRTIKAEVEGRVIDYSVNNQVKERLQGEIASLVKSAETKKAFDEGIRGTMETALRSDVGKKFDQTIREKTDQLKALSAKDLAGLLPIIPVGTILAWVGDSTTTLPPGYSICDGSLVKDPE